MKDSRATMAAIVLGLFLTADAAAQAERQGPPPIIHQMAMVVEDTKLHVKGGYPFDQCAILIGLQKRDTPLPGGAWLQIDPLVVLVRGEFDVLGQFTYDFSDVIDQIKDPLAAFVQAIAMVHDSNFFMTSNVLTLGIATN